MWPHNEGNSLDNIKMNIKKTWLEAVVDRSDLTQGREWCRVLGKKKTLGFLKRWHIF